MIVTQKGFTLMEVMVTVIILSVIVSIAWPSYIVTIERTRSSEGIRILESLMNAQRLYQLDNGAYTNNIDNLEVTIPAAKNFNAPTVAVANPIASIQRKNGLYTLAITNDGVVSCTNGTATYCGKIGY